MSFLKAPRALDGHPRSTNSTLSEQQFIFYTFNTLQKSAQWRHTAVIIAYDDSDGWYDRITGPVVNHSNVPGADVLAGRNCAIPPAGVSLGRCGYGARLPFLVISLWARLWFSVARLDRDRSDRFEMRSVGFRCGSGSGVQN